MDIKLNQNIENYIKPCDRGGGGRRSEQLSQEPFELEQISQSLKGAPR